MRADPPVRFHVEDNVGVVTLNDAGGMNALGEDLLEGLTRAVDSARDDASVRALLIRAEGRAFCAGADLAEIKRRLADSSGGGASAYVACLLEQHAVPLLLALRRLPMVVVCAVGGAAVGGGVGLALAADMVIASRSAYFSLPFVPSLGLIPDLGATSRLTRTLGPARAIGLALTGEKFTAEQAERWGLVWKCVPDESLSSEAMALARRCAGLYPEAVRAAKSLFDSAETAAFAEQLGLETDAQRRLAGAGGFREGVNAFLERRSPNFSDLSHGDQDVRSVD